MAINFNAEPYHDDFDETKKFYKVLFKPGYAVQTRELNQLQSILQGQINTHGKHIFKEGAMVIPGNSSVDTNASYVKLTVNDILPSSLIGTNVTGLSSKVTGTIIHISPNTGGNDLPTLYIKYTNSGQSNEKVFSNSEELRNSANVKVATVASSAATGFGSLASIQPGFYFIKGCFVYVAAQTIELDKYTNTPSYKIGLEAFEEFIDSEEDDTLLDNANGTFNFNAPGADRYRINLVLNKKNINEATAGSFIIGEVYTISDPGNTDFTLIGSSSNLLGTTFTATGKGTGTGKAIINEKDFIQLIVVKAGKVLQKISTTEYSILEQTLARRTFDESGDYTVRNFPIDVREYRNNDRGNWAASTIYLAGDVVLNAGEYYRCRMDGTSNSTAPTQTVGSTTAGTTGVIWTYESKPYFNRGINNVVSGETLTVQNANKDKLALGLEPGKAYVKGYEIEKTATSYIPVNKARDVLQQTNITIPATVGNYIIVTNVFGEPNVTLFPTVKLFNRLTVTGGTEAGTAVGTARIRYIEDNRDTTAGTQTTKYKVSLFDIQMSAGYNFNRDVKQLFITGGVSAGFTADVFPVLNQLSGALSASTTTITGTATLFNSELKVGDYIYFNIGGTAYSRRVATITSNTSLTIDSSIGVTVAGEIGYRVETSILETENESLLFPITYPFVKSVRNASNANGTTYTASQIFTKTSTSGGLITIDVSGADTFASISEADNYLVVRNDTGVVVVPSSITYGASQVQLQMPAASAISYTIIAAINRSTGNEKTKTRDTFTFTTTSQSVGQATTVKLGKTDGLRLLAVYMDTGTWASPTGTYSIDITSRYSFDDGQKSTHYDLCSIILNAGESAPTAPIRVHFEYFTHSGTGDYFTVNSYLSTISYDEIPSFNNTPLAWVFDFRPKIDDDGTTFSTASLLPKRGIDIQSDFQHYKQRKDKLALDQNGSFYAITGTSDIIATEPSDPATGMVLYKLTYQPYTYTTNSLNIDTIDNKRYTMRDIGKLEKRIDNIEYYTSLSMLEQASQSLEIQDEFGLNRFKNGFAVDNFTGAGIGELSSPDYRCAVDMENGLVRPSYYMSNVNLIEYNTTDAQRTADSYKVTGELITLPYTEVELVQQLDASRVENINPFAIFTFIGNIDLNPPSDEWFEVNRLPDVVTNVEGNFDSLYYIAERSGALNTVWNAWQTQWTGTSTTVRQTISADRRTGDGGAALDARFGVGADVGGWAARTVTADVISTQVGQSRTGIRTLVIPRIDMTTTADRTLSTAVIPYIRARSLLFVVRGLKPNTTFTPFFDSVNINTFTTQATKITIPRNTVFSSSAQAGGDSSEISRRFNGNAENALNRGDVVYVKSRGGITYTKDTSPATGVLSLVVNQLNPVTAVTGTTTDLHLVNVRGTFAVDDKIAGSITAAGVAADITITTGNITTYAKGAALKSNEAGDLVGIFDIPNTDSNRFRTGVREFKLSDNINDDSTRTSVARKQYRAEGIIETKQASVTATRNADLVQNIVNQNQTIIQTSDRVVSDTGWYDPLAQTFLVDSVGGAFITSVDIFFATRDAAIPVRMQIREVVNGYPGKVILPFSQVTVTPDKVNISSTTVLTSELESYPAPVATNFKFDSPVYLNDKTEYAIVLLSDSNNYKAWISQLGDTSVVNSRVISEQPYAGVLFKSQNASTWTANQNQDLMFKINKAKFTTNTYGEVDFVNTTIPTDGLAQNPFYIKSGIKDVRVTHENHGFSIGSKVVISGASLPFTSFAPTIAIGGATGQFTCTPASSIGIGYLVNITGTKGGTSTFTGYVSGNTYKVSAITGTFPSVTGFTLTNLDGTGISTNAGTLTGLTYTISGLGITAADLNTEQTILSADIDSYVFQVSALNSTFTGNVGGSAVVATQNILYNTVQPIIQEQVFQNTSITYKLKTVSGKSINGTETAYTASAFNPIAVNQNNSLSALAMIGTTAVETANMPSDANTGTKSVALRANLITTNENISPVIDTARTSLIVIQDRVNSPTLANINYSALDTRDVVASTNTIGSGYILAYSSGGASGVNTVTFSSITAVNLNGSSITGTGIPTGTTILSGAGTATLILSNNFTTQASGNYQIFSNSFVTSNATTKNSFLTLSPGKYIVVSGFASPAAANNSSWLVTEVATDGSYVKVDGNLAVIAANATGATTVVVKSADRFVDEIAPFGSSSIAKYVTKKISLQNASTFLKVRFAADNEQYANIKMYYKLQNAGSTADFSKTIYTLANPTIAAIVSNDGSFTDVEYNIPNLTAFDAVQIKLVINSTYGSNIVRVKDLQIIGCA